MSDKRGTFTFNFAPPYDQELDKDNARFTLATSDYRFEVDLSDGVMDTTTYEIQFHFNAFLRSLGYVVDNDNYGDLN